MASILVIDDDTTVTEKLGTLLSEAGNEVTTADNGKAALKLLAREHFDVVITDIVMPEADGFEVIRHLIGRTRRPRIIAMTGDTDRLDHIMLSRVARCMSVNQVLHKPFSDQDLMASIAG
ncbi:response regulator [Trichlorobacter ammonificans]|uniref:Response regulator receiver domain-containing protein n=1 Tax=Trichlorobacter ammonificans TaxID=2916410 RepID=A0ABN8HC50_9BACT|nr:response regulator [Trichlorobacter ammonificans]CAH2030170.1 Response regulator receiver domain-containing protein [Trichlorobacter ammonificans]